MKNLMTRRAFALTAGLAAGGAVAATTLAAAAGATATVLKTRTATSTLFIPCPSCVQESVPKGAHIGGEEIDAGALLSTPGRAVSRPARTPT